MAFLDFLNRQNILGKLDQVRQGVARNLPYITGVGAGLIAAPVGLAPLGGFVGYGGGRILQEAFAPESVSQTPSIGLERNLPDPYKSLARAGAVGLGFGAVQPLLNKLPTRYPTPQPIPQTPTQQATLQAHRDQALLRMAEDTAAQEGANIKSVFQGLELRQQEIERLLGQRTLTGEGLEEQAAGWQPGMRKVFDTAMASGDIETIRKLLPQVPPEYAARFKAVIDRILGGGAGITAGGSL